jgi:spore germination protein GerM
VSPLRAGFLIRRISVGLGILILLGALGVAGIVAWHFRRQGESRSAAAGELALPRGTRSVTLYFATARGDSLVPEIRQVLETDRVTETIQILIQELVRGPSPASRTRAVLPKGASVRHVFFDEGGNATVDFSPDLAWRFRGGSTAEYLLLASLVRTISVNLPTVTSVTVTLGGRPAATLGGHFALEAPLAVSDWR